MAGGVVKRAKISEDVVRYVLDCLFEGRLRSGDRIDIDEVADELGISRSPVREALVVLERDGMVSTRYHRGVFVEPFDAEAIEDFFEIYGHLSALAVAKLAKRPDPAVLEQLKQALRELQALPAEQPGAVEDKIRDIMRIQHRAGGSARLRAQLRTFTGFARVAGGRDRDRLVQGQARVIRAIAAGDPEKASRHRIEDFKAAGREAAKRLRDRGIFAVPNSRSA